MRYKGKVYRPPSEAYSLIIQVTYGCSHNRCAFCDMYDDKRFALRPMEEIREDFRLARQVYRRVERVFLADGDALMRKTDELLEILAMVYSLFPECQRVTCYASPRSLQVKTEEELRRLREGKSVYFSEELCARYFTYRTGSENHYVLFDDAQTLRKKAALAENRGIREGFFMLPEVADIAGELLG